MQWNILKNFLFIISPSKKSNVKRLKNINQLAELPLYKQLSVVKTNQTLMGYEILYKVEITGRKDPLVQLGASK